MRETHKENKSKENGGITIPNSNYTKSHKKNITDADLVHEVQAWRGGSVAKALAAQV
jgi:hypothetical protein